MQLKLAVACESLNCPFLFMLHHTLYAPSGICHYKIKYAAEAANQTEIDDFYLIKRMSLT